jgi:hypothetical protein
VIACRVGLDLVTDKTEMRPGPENPGLRRLGNSGLVFLSRAFSSHISYIHLRRTLVALETSTTPMPRAERLTHRNT